MSRWAPSRQLDDAHLYGVHLYTLMDSFKFKKTSSGVWLCNKPVSKTPLEAVLELKKQQPRLAKLPITYAGRLDPMAEGLLILLSGKKVYEKEKFLKLEKTYQVTAILGFGTDSFDLLGLPQLAKLSNVLSKKQILSALATFQGQVTLPLPRYSSPPLNGKALHHLTRAGLLRARDIPSRTTTIFHIQPIGPGKVSSTLCLAYLYQTIPLVSGDFRQNKILRAWQKILNNSKDIFQTVTFEVHCQSGTYIRSVVNELGKKLGTKAVVFKLRRTQVGQFSLPKL